MPTRAPPRLLLLLLLVLAVPWVGRSLARLAGPGARPSAVAGCDVVLADDGSLRCTLPASTSASEAAEVVLWLEGEDVIDPKVELLTPWGRDSLRVRKAFLDSGTQLVVEVHGGGMLEIAGFIDDPEAGRTLRRQWAVELEVRPATPRLDEIEARWAAADDGQSVQPLLDELRTIALVASPRRAAEAWGLRGELLRRTASPSEALDDFERALQAAGPHELSLRCRLLRTIVELQIVGREDHAAATEGLMRMEPCTALGLAHRAPLAGLLGNLALRRGHLEDAIDHLQRAVAGAEQLRLRRVGMTAAGLLAVAETRAQRFEAAAEALAQAQRLARHTELDCQDELGLAAQAAIVAVEDRNVHGPAALEALRVLEVVFETCQASSTIDVLGALNIAYALQRAERHAEAQGWLDRLDGRVLAPQQQMYRASIAADVAMARHDWAGAARAADALARLLDRHPHEATLALEVQRELVRGRVAKATGRLDAARAHLRRAIDLQDDQLRLLPLGLSTSRVSAVEAGPAQHLVELQREQGELDAALCTARLLRNRAGQVLFDAARLFAQGHARYQQLEADVRRKEVAFEEAERKGSAASLARAKAELQAARRTLIAALAHAGGLSDYTPRSVCEALPAPARGELVLLFHQDPQGRWWLFDWSLDAPVRIQDVGLGDPASTDDPQHLVERFLHPVRDRLAHASRVRLLTAGATHDIVFEALPWDGGTLEERVLVTWGLDLPRRPGLDLGSDDGLEPVVVYTDLYHEFQRVEPQVQALLQTVEAVWGSQVPMLVGDGTSTRDLLEFSGGAAPLVLIGHNSALAELDVANPRCGDTRSPGAPGSVVPGLVQAPDRPPPGVWINQTSMGLDTVLTLAPPRVAILESCATGPVDVLGLDAPVGLGHALVAAGAQQVLVTRRIVCPEQALGLLAALVRASGRDPLDLPVLLRAARSEDPDYLHRVLVP